MRFYCEFFIHLHTLLLKELSYDKNAQCTLTAPLASLLPPWDGETVF